MDNPHRTKSRYLAEAQCPRRLWLLVNDRPNYNEPPARFSLEIGYEFGQKTHLLRPGGVLVDEEPWRHAEAVARTAALMADPSVRGIRACRRPRGG